MTNEVKKRLLDVLQACEAISEFIQGKDFLAYETDRMLRSAVERQFEVIGEALTKAAITDASLYQKIPELPKIVGLRNRLIHGYDSVDDEILWDIVQTKLPVLKNQVAAWLHAEAEAL